MTVTVSEIEHMSDDELLEYLRGQFRSSWWYTCADLDDLARRAAERGRLRLAYDAADATGVAGTTTSSNPSRARVVFGSEGRTEDKDAFARTLRDELSKVLTDS
jgi:hypothetical protein